MANPNENLFLFPCLFSAMMNIFVLWRKLIPENPGRVNVERPVGHKVGLPVSVGGVQRVVPLAAHVVKYPTHTRQLGNLLHLWIAINNLVIDYKLSIHTKRSKNFKVRAIT